ncbi:hypothetical protein ThesuDRAFT_01595 [Thermaerobacter subterraneus DSM 13965]|uniref:Uncharacterized protein n=1 Tax=Thermaerobacter subterraneus DSM 13965 TaxID=867903 RepID=K6P452_9FIRM|nr:hypothetical protein ThesuDRAFT_01595 [Thermaerobacter subterraneus DSM 13965]
MDIPAGNRFRLISTGHGTGREARGKVVKSAVRVFVNNHPVDVYPGASVRHALLRYSETVYQDTVAGKLVVTDRHGNRLGLGGVLEEGLRLTVEGPGGFRPGPARPAAGEVAATGAPHGTNGTVRPAASSLAAGQPAGGRPAGTPAMGMEAAGANGVAHPQRGEGRRRRRGRRRGNRRGRHRAQPDAGRQGRAPGGQASANGTG